MRFEVTIVARLPREVTVAGPLPVPGRAAGTDQGGSASAAGAARASTAALTASATGRRGRDIPIRRRGVGRGYAPARSPVSGGSRRAACWLACAHGATEW